MVDQTLRSRLWPIQGLSFEPEFPDEIVYLRGNFEPRLSWIVGTSDTGSTIIEATSAGALKVADTGSGLENYSVMTGTATSTPTSIGATEPFSSYIVSTETEALDIAFIDSSGATGDTYEVPAGETLSNDYTASDMLISDSTSTAVYKIMIMW